jgi:GT2 family glycosyltransferase
MGSDPSDGAALPAWAAVVINWNGAADLPSCLQALAAQTHPPAETIVLDNASRDDSLAILRDYPAVRVLASQENLGFAGGANAGIRATSAPLVATFNPDVVLNPAWAATLTAAFAADPRLGAAGGKLLYPDRTTIQHAGGRLEQPLLVGVNIGRGEPDTGQYDMPGEVDFVTGGAMLLRRAAIEPLGLFDEGFYPAYYEDLDLCLRLHAAGWSVRYLPAATGLHRESSSVDARSAAYYRMIHAARLRFAAKALTPHDFVTRFLPAELARLRRELQHLSDPAGLDATGLTAYPPDLADAGRAEPLLALARDPDDQSAPDARSFVAQIVEVGRRWLVEERPFTSSTPLLAPLIVWLRTRLINAGPRWHVRQILDQQIEFNAAVYRALAALSGEAQATDAGLRAATDLLSTRLEALTEQQAALLARVEALEERLRALEPSE